MNDTQRGSSKKTVFPVLQVGCDPFSLKLIELSKETYSEWCGNFM